MTARLAARAVAALVVTITSLAAVGPASADTQACQVGATRYLTSPSANLEEIGVAQSFGVASGRGVTVAVVDSGVNVGNQHLGPAVVKGGKSFVPGPPDQDENGHGTAIAGIIAARLLPGKSAVIGAAPSATIMPVRVYVNESQPGEAPQPYSPNVPLIARGIRWAADHGADVINVSLSAPASDSSLPALARAVRHAYAKGIPVVASSGDVNGGGQSVSVERFPAAFPQAVAVAAANSSGRVDDYSVHGSWVDVSAPGQNVYVTYNANGDCQSGDIAQTSYSAAFVSALAAQLKEKYPDESIEQLVYRIEASAQRPVESQRDDQEGWGLIQPYDALTMTLDPSRAGPAFPGSASDSSSAAGPVKAVIPPVVSQANPLESTRSQVLWWVIGGGGLVALALVLRPVVLQLASTKRSSPGRRRASR